MRNKVLFTFLSLSLYGGSLTLALDTPAEEAGWRKAAETAAAISALGASPASKPIGTIVFKAIRASSDSVLPITDATVRVAPLPAVPEIVIAAIAAVPNPWKKVIYYRLTGPDQQGSPGPRPGEPSADAANGIPMTLAEAIVRTAFDARPGLSLRALEDAANVALRMDPATLLRDIYMRDIQSGSTVSTYENEPLRTPNQPAVSP